VKRGKAVEKLIFLFGTTQKALVASQEQKIADTRKIAQQNNKTFLKALSCAEKKNGKCTKQDNTKRTCEVCVSCNLCDEIIKKMKTITSTGNKNIDPELDAWSERVLEGMRRMSTDEKFRKEIESKIT
jgi:hypothetical protein